MDPTTDQSQAQSATYPLQFITLADHLAGVPAPAVRLSLCGDLMIEVLQQVVSTDPPLGRYQRLAVWRVHGRGMAPVLILLKQLASRPQRYAAKDWLREHTRREAEAVISAKRLDDITSPLRGLLCPPEQQELRTLLVRYIHASSHSGDGYQLAAYPLVWLDSDAVAWNVQQAARMERFGDDSLPFWQRAYDLASRGPYLVDEPYSQWAEERRAEVEADLRQSVHALARLYVARWNEAGEAEALLLLRTHWQQHPTDEDALRPLMELLGKQERYQEALSAYQHLCEVVEEEEREPDARTQDIAAYLRTKQIQREPARTHPVDTGKSSYETQHSTLEKVSFQEYLSTALTQGIIVAAQQREKEFMDNLRRNLLQVLLVPMTVIGLRRELSSLTAHLQNPERLTLFEQELVTQWDVYHTGGTKQAYQGLSMWIGDVKSFANDSKGDILHGRALNCLCMNYQLEGSLYRDMMRFDEARTSYRKAFEVAKGLENLEYQACAMARSGVAFIQQQIPDEAITYLNEALNLTKELFLPCLRGYIFQALSEAHAMAQHDYESQYNIDRAQEALEQRGKAPERSQCQSNTTSVAAQRGVNAVLLQQHSQAIKLIDEGLEKYNPSLIRGRARLKAQKAEAYYGLGLIDLCSTEAIEAWLLGHSIGSNKTLARVRKLHLDLVLSRWKKESSVADLSWVIENL